MTSEKEEPVWFSVVRMAPDPVRQETANVAVIVAGLAGVEVRALKEATPQVRAIAPPQASALIPTIEKTLLGLMQGGGPERLHQLSSDGLGGFLITEPKRLVLDRRHESVESAAEMLYGEYIRPRSWRTEEAAHPRIETELKRAFRLGSGVLRERLALGLTVKGRFADYRFPLAYANGKPTIVQAVDLDVKKASQDEQTQATIATVAEVERLLDIHPAWLTVVRRGTGWQKYAGRLGAFSETVEIDHLDALVGRVAGEADRPVEAAFVERGIPAERHNETVVVGVAAGT